MARLDMGTGFYRRRAAAPLNASGGCSLSGHSLPDRLDLGMLEPEQLRDAPRELVLDGREHAVRVHDAPDHLDQTQALLAREVLRHQARELIEVDALAALLLGETDDLQDVLLGDAEILAHGAKDTRALLVREAIFGGRDLQHNR